MEIKIRAGELSDYKDIALMLSEKSVYSQMLQLPFPSEDSWKERVERQQKDPNSFTYVAEVKDGENYIFAGNISLFLLKSLRRRHVGTLGMGVKEIYQGKGVGSKLLETVIDIADNWFNLLRVELEVYTDNQSAISLYKKYGFKIEGRLKKYAFRDGRYVDVFCMGRIKR